MAQRAAIGAKYMMIRTIPKRATEANSRNATIGLPRACARLRLNPSSTAMKSTGMMSPFTNGSTKDVGIIDRKKSVNVTSLATFA